VKALTDGRIRIMLRFMVGDACLFNTSPGLVGPRNLLKALGISLAAGLVLVLLSGCNDEDPLASKPLDPIQVLKQAHVRDLATALTQAYEQFDSRNFDACIAFCNYVLSREPEYSVAMELAEDAEKVKAREEYYDFLRAKVENWKKRTDAGPEARVPYMGGTEGDVLTYPHLGLPKPVPTFPSAPESLSASKMD